MLQHDEIGQATRAVGKQLADWRKNHHAPTPIPDSIWSTAGALAARFGIAPIARALRLDYASLKRRMDTPVGGHKGIAQSPVTPLPESTFLEWLSPASTLNVGECVIELEGRRGRLRLEMRNVPASGLVEIVRELAG